MSFQKTVLIVHSIDTEGPLYESLLAKFERIQELYGIDHIPPTKENLEKLQRSELDLDGLEKHVARTLNGHLVNYNDTWDKIDVMLERIMAPKFRNALPDSFGGGWVYNWHCLDHVGYEYNPRRRDMGYHSIFDHYKSILDQNTDCRDRLHWHFHPMSTYRDAHRCATSFVNSPELYQILCRRVLERDWFPSVYRAGFQTERPDSNSFLEHWVPFDISNMAMDDNSELESTIDFRDGRSGDWRLAPSDWSIYHPSHDYYQLPGNCRRWIARALNVLNRIGNINQKEMDKAFFRAQKGEPTLVGVTGHDFRNLETEVEYIRELIGESKRRYPDVTFKYCEATEGFRHAIWPKESQFPSLELDLFFKPASEQDVPSIVVETKKGKVFGPQPFLAIRTHSRRFIHDNLDFSTSLDSWSYAFHSDTLPISDVAEIGVAANDKYGNTCIRKLDFSSSIKKSIN